MAARFTRCFLVFSIGYFCFSSTSFAGDLEAGYMPLCEQCQQRNLRLNARDVLEATKVFNEPQEWGLPQPFGAFVFPNTDDLATYTDMGSSRPYEENARRDHIPGVRGHLLPPLTVCRPSSPSYSWRNLSGHNRYFHPAEDQGAEPGTPIQNVAPGVVVKAVSHCTDDFAKNLSDRPGRHCDNDHNWGNRLLIMHKTAGGEIFYTGSHHLGEVNYSVGDQVPAGAIIGTVGSTGTSSAPHLHWEIMDANQVRSNPLAYYEDGEICANTTQL